MPGQGVLVFDGHHGPRATAGPRAGNGGENNRPLPCEFTPADKILAPRRIDPAHSQPTVCLPRAHCSGCSELPRMTTMSNELPEWMPPSPIPAMPRSMPTSQLTSCSVGPIGKASLSQMLHKLRTHRPLPLFPSCKGHHWDDLTASCVRSGLPLPNDIHGARLERDIISTGTPPPDNRTSSGISAAMGGPGYRSRGPYQCEGNRPLQRLTNNPQSPQSRPRAIPMWAVRLPFMRLRVAAQSIAMGVLCVRGGGTVRNSAAYRQSSIAARQDSGHVRRRRGSLKT